MSNDRSPVFSLSLQVAEGILTSSFSGRRRFLPFLHNAFIRSAISLVIHRHRPRYPFEMNVKLLSLAQLLTVLELDEKPTSALKAA